MWNDKVEATPKTSAEVWIVPTLFLLLAAAGAFALGYTYL